jgi:hypothetical protein
MRCAVRQYLRPYTRATSRKAGEAGIKQPRHNGQDKGMAYPCQKICKELLGYRCNNQQAHQGGTQQAGQPLGRQEWQERKGLKPPPALQEEGRLTPPPKKEYRHLRLPGGRLRCRPFPTLQFYNCTQLDDLFSVLGHSMSISHREQPDDPFIVLGHSSPPSMPQQGMLPTI